MDFMGPDLDADCRIAESCLRTRECFTLSERYGLLDVAHTAQLWAVSVAVFVTSQQGVADT